MRFCRLRRFIGVSFLSGVACAATPDTTEILVETSRVVLTRADYDTEVDRVIPEDRRVQFAMDPQRLTKFVNNLLTRKTLAVEARELGLDRDPPLPADTKDVDGALARRRIEKIERDAVVDFDRRSDAFTGRARELYLADKAKYATPAEIDVSQIVIADDKRGQEAALALANEVVAKLAAGADFAALARDVSDAPAGKTNGGHLGWRRRDELASALADAAFKLVNVGDVSAPVPSKLGYHLIRLDGRKPPRQRTFDEVRVEILAGLKTQYASEQVALKMNAVAGDPTLRVNQRALDSLVVQIDPEIMRKALQAGQAPLAK